MSFRKEHPSLHMGIQYVLINIFYLSQSHLHREHVEKRWEVVVAVWLQQRGLCIVSDCACLAL